MISFMANTLGKRISELRRSRNLTQDALAEELGITAQAVSKWENDISCPDIMMLPQLADYFSVSIDELLRGDNAKQARMVPVTEPRDLNKILLKIQVQSADGDKVKVNLPFSLIKMGLEIGMSMPQIQGGDVLKNIDFGAIVSAVECGAMGKLIEVDSADSDHVEIYVE